MFYGSGDVSVTAEFFPYEIHLNFELELVVNEPCAG